MHRSSETIGAIAAALAKAQGELSNPEKALVANIKSPSSQGEERSFRYASLASGLDIVRKCLGQQEIATVQTTAIDQGTGQIQLTTLLAHSSGEWISSEWPVCAMSDMSAPQRMGTALTYARRYALFALVGIAGEDDLDAPEPVVEHPSPISDRRPPAASRPANGTVHRPQVLDAQSSALLRDELVVEINQIHNGEELALWAHRRLPAKNTLMQADAELVEAAYAIILSQAFVVVENESNTRSDPNRTQPFPDEAIITEPPAGLANRSVTPIVKTVRRRSKAHLVHVASQPCLVCQRSPCDAHHLKFAQPHAMGRKVSDEFTVPLCRDHHYDLHRQGNEMAWWKNLKLVPISVARELWLSSPVHGAQISHKAVGKQFENGSAPLVPSDDTPPAS